MQEKTIITATRLVVGYGQHALLPPFDLSIGTGDLLAIIGRNGCGKSTLAHTLVGLQPALAGSVERVRRTRCALVEQRWPLPEHSPLTVDDVMTWSDLRPGNLVWRPGRTVEAADHARRHLAAAGADHLLGRRMSTLSEGERQRVRYARAMGSDPELLILDEPTSALDRPGEEAVFAALAQACTKGLAAVVVVHDARLASRFATRVVYLDRDCQEVVQGSFAEVAASDNYRRHFGNPETDT